MGCIVFVHSEMVSLLGAGGGRLDDLSISGAVRS